MQSDGNRIQKKMEKVFKQRAAKKAKQAKERAENTAEKVSIS